MTQISMKTNFQIYQKNAKSAKVILCENWPPSGIITGNNLEIQGSIREELKRAHHIFQNNKFSAEMGTFSKHLVK